MKKVLAAFLCVATLVCLFCVTGCSSSSTKISTGSYISDNESVAPQLDQNVEDATVAQPQVDKSNFPSNYAELESDVYNVVATKKRTKGNKTTGSDFLKIVYESKGVIDDDLQEIIKKEVTGAVTEQVDGVTCMDAVLSVDENNENMAYLTVTFTYDETGAMDSKIYNVPIGS